MPPLNSAARNADTPEGRRFMERVKGQLRAARDKADLAAVRDRMVRELQRAQDISDDEKDALEGEIFHAHGEEVRRMGRNAEARNGEEFGFAAEFGDAKIWLDRAILDANSAYERIAMPAKTYTPQSAKEKSIIDGGIASVSAAVKSLRNALSFVRRYYA